MARMSEQSSSARTEQIIQAYFEQRPGWTVAKLDSGKTPAADFRICHSEDCILCEVKTVVSVRANYPGKPIDSHLDQRKKKLEEIERWRTENPGKHLILPPGEFEFMYGDEADFIKKFGGRNRNTKKGFDKFDQTMKGFLASSSVKDLPYRLRLDSDDLYSPNRAERDKFFEWLVSEIQEISQGNPSWQWQRDRVPLGETTLFSAFYEIHAAAHENDVKAEYQLTLEGPRGSGGLEVSIFSYGGLNLDAITRNVEAGIRQLESSAAREGDQQIPRVIALAFESGIGFEWPELFSHIVWLLKSHPDLSAVAVLDWVSDGTPPPLEDGFFAWVGFHATGPQVPRFIVYHNPWLHDVRALSTDVFSDEWSAQLTPLR
jgi:hypothetical protein